MATQTIAAVPSISLASPDQTMETVVVGISGHIIGEYFGVHRMLFRVPAEHTHVPGSWTASEEVAAMVDSEEQVRARALATRFTQLIKRVLCCGLTEIDLYRMINPLLEMSASLEGGVTGSAIATQPSEDNDAIDEEDSETEAA